MDDRPGLPTRLLMGLVRGYQLLFSAWLRAGCRYSPSCSNYAMQSLRRHGAAAGTYLAVGRVLRCNPFCLGGHDPVPDNPPRLFTRFTERPSRCPPGSASSTANPKASHD